MALMVMQGALISSNYFVSPCPQLRDKPYTGLHRQLGLLLRPLKPVILTASCQGGRRAKSQRLTCRATAAAAAATVVGNDGSLANSNGNARLPPSPSEATLAKIIPYLWSLASSDTTLRWRLAAALVLLFASKTAGLAGPVLFKQAMDELAKAPLDRTTPVLVALVFAALSKAISSGLNEVRYIIFAPLGQATGRRVGVELLNHILLLDLTFHLERRTGALSRILDRAQRSVVNIFRAVVFTFVPTFVELILVCGLLATRVSSKVAGVVLLTFAAYVAWTVQITSRAAESRKEVNKLENLATGKAVDALLNYETVVQFNNQKLEVDQYNTLLQGYQDASLVAERLSAALNAGQAFILSVGIASVMAIAGLQVAQGTSTIGDLVLANGLILQLSGPLQFLGFLYRDLRQSQVDLESLFTILATQPLLKDGTVELAAAGQGAKVRANNLRFSYTSSREVLLGINLQANPGESIALVGASGSGKSTIVKLLLRLYDPDSGTLFLDDQDIRTLTQDSLRSAVAVVPQDTVLFNDTIMHNIAYGRPNATQEQIIQAAKQARLHDAVLRMPEGYQTMVGERGLKLSGGEKQRVAIARAFLKSPRLLICDEATSALDSGTEAAILKSLKELAAGRTCVFVAHRLSTIMHCDRILVMDAGIVVEEGTHQELVATGGRYAHMWALQESEDTKKIKV
jgi:ABC-type transport system involved in Fe-S cluster assembly fused permease/ATPase subunit